VSKWGCGRQLGAGGEVFGVSIVASEIRKRVSDRAGCYGLRRGRVILEAFGTDLDDMDCR